MGINKSKYKNLKKLLEEETSSNQEVVGKSLLHWHHGKPMIKIENLGPWNIASFYVCSNKECHHKEIPYLGRILNHKAENYYQHFNFLLSLKK